MPACVEEPQVPDLGGDSGSLTGEANPELLVDQHWNLRVRKHLGGLAAKQQAR